MRSCMASHNVVRQIICSHLAWFERLDQSLVGDQASPRALATADLLASPLSIMPASIFRALEAGTRAFMMRFSRPGTTLERFLSRPLRPSDTHCSTLIGFIGIVFGSKPNFSSTGVFVNPAASTVTYTPRGLNS